jgi:hypothetical protein
MTFNRFRFLIFVVGIMFFTSLVVVYTSPIVDAQPPEPGRPTDDGGGGGSDDDDDGGSSPQTGEIRGVVTNLTTGQPAGGVKVSLNGGVITTDGAGKYSFTNLGPNTYSVALDVGDIPNASPVQGPQLVNLPSGGLAIVDLQFIIGPVVTPTPIPTPTIAVPEAPAADSPPELPSAGGVAPDSSYLSISGPATYSADVSSVLSALGLSRIAPVVSLQAELPTALCSSVYIVRTGEQFTDIAQTFLGTSAEAARIIEATNLSRVEHPSFAKISDPFAAKAGYQLCIPN